MTQIVRLYYSVPVDPDNSPIYNAQELIAEAETRRENDGEADTPVIDSVDDAIQYLEEMCDWNPIREIEQTITNEDIIHSS